MLHQDGEVSCDDAMVVGHEDQIGGEVPDRLGLHGVEVETIGGGGSGEGDGGRFAGHATRGSDGYQLM